MLRNQKEHSQPPESSAAVLRISAACQQVKRKQDGISSSGQKATDQDSIFALCKTFGPFCSEAGAKNRHILSLVLPVRMFSNAVYSGYLPFIFLSEPNVTR